MKYLVLVLMVVACCTIAGSMASADSQAMPEVRRNIQPVQPERGSAQPGLVLPQTPESLIALAHRLGIEGRLAEAEVVYVNGMAAFPLAEDVHIAYGNLLEAEGRLDEAVLVYGRAEMLAPKPVFGHAGGSNFQPVGTLGLDFGSWRSWIGRWVQIANDKIGAVRSNWKRVVLKKGLQGILTGWAAWQVRNYYRSNGLYCPNPPWWLPGSLDGPWYILTCAEYAR